MANEAFRGYGLTSTIKWVNETLDESEREKVYAALPDEFRASLDDIKPSEWYPRVWFDAILRAVADVRGTTIEEKYAVIEELGTFIARDNQSTVLSLLMKFLTPSTILRQLPKLWSKYHTTGVAKYIETDEPNTGIIELEGFSGVRYIEPTVRAWIRTAYVAVGVPEIDIKEVHNSLEDENPTFFRWEFSWSS
jgi:hypothetical protein